MSMKSPKGKVIAAGETWKVPCGILFISVSPVADGTTFNFRLPGGVVLSDIKVPFTYAFPCALDSKTADPWQVIAVGGTVNVFYVT
jgi:hypothetical protein